MKFLKNVVWMCLFFSMNVFSEQASEETVKQLMAITHSQKLLEGVYAQLDVVMNNSTKQVLNGKTPAPKQQQAIDNMKEKTIDLIKNEMSWEKLEPVYIRLYRETFTEEEASGMIAFYKTPAGQAVINKMPILTQKNLLEMQKLMGVVMPGMKKIQEEFAAEIKAAGAE